MEDSYNLCFIIAHRYYRNYQSFIQYYVDNIQKMYTNSFIIIVDNNSKYIDDIKHKLSNYSNLVILSNDTPCKFEIGAYKVGINYLIDNNLVNKYDFCIFTQDNFILNKKYDFNLLKNDGVKACTLGIGDIGHHCGMLHSQESQHVLRKLGLENKIDDVRFCWCCSFILHGSKILDFLNITSDIIIKVRIQSEYAERYLSAILYVLNDNKHYGLFDVRYLNYDLLSVDLINNNSDYCFMKKFQQKNECTIDE